MLTSAPKGTKDRLPSEVYKWQYVENKFLDICGRYGFSEIRTPVFEYTELFTKGVGSTTDIVQKEMYSFKDHGSRDITLKPEGTSPVVRAFVEHKQYADVQPTKYCYVTPCFRYEKPQSGRLREFHQFGVEIFGTPNMLADAEVICLAHEFLAEMGIRDIKLKINSVGCADCRKRHREALKDYVRPRLDKLCSACRERFDRNPMRIIDCKSKICREVLKDAPMMTDYLCDECGQAFEDVKKNLDALGIGYEVDPRIVRGLDYYTKTAFEFVTESIGAQGTVCGGGRYDHLVEEIGGPPIPGVGFGLGIERLLMLMDINGAEIPKPKQLEVFIAVMGDRARACGLSLLRRLRAKGIRAEMDTLGRNIRGQFRYADRLGAKYTVVIGEDELAAGVVSVKEMAVSEQRLVSLEDLMDELTK